MEMWRRTLGKMPSESIREAELVLRAAGMNEDAEGLVDLRLSVEEFEVLATEGASDFDEREEELNERISELEYDLSDIKEELETAEEKIESFGQERSALEAQISELEAEVQSLREQIEARNND